ncbi:flagellar motor protein PomA [Paraglaciecola aquimarina]|uniref:Flagellar motor protein PomA n=1 Tax=Paraglaciecola aquimarina TaxID=1235557 RepID=A0ABU3SXV1_9ALTE|nr:flagellar motor protein PomA [Paraglaciecola aquimarina]MDU0354833.1 flagellar motor protein PomA [Paraglaciecola aquimarina]
MDLASIIGILGAIGFVVMAMIQGGDIGMFINVPSILIVFCGSLFVVLSQFTLGQFLGAGKIAGKAFMFKIDSPDALIEKIVEMADAARKGGFLALEEAEIDNPFMQKGVDMLVDGHDVDVVKATLSKDISMTTERHEFGASIFKNLGDVGPAMGMIGTLVGLVAMLSNMDDPKSIGPAMAVALLTTLYGAMLANLLCIPIAIKLGNRCEEEKLNQNLVLDGIVGIADGQNPRVIEGILKNYLAASKRGSDEEAE